MDSGWIPDGIYWKNMDSVDSGHIKKKEKYHAMPPFLYVTESTESILFQ